MGERGPAPTPTRILQMRGSWRGKLRRNEPKPERKSPHCPAWLRKEAKRAWKEITPQLEAMGVLGRCDRSALARYCQTLAKWREAEEFLMEHGSVYPVKSADGSIVEIREYPQVGRAIRLAEQLLRLEKQFGLTPSARAGMGLSNNPDYVRDAGKERFFKRSS